MRDMNLRHLRAFVSIADAGGFARAANRMNLSQPALSRQIHALETELGVPLFDRLGRRVRLTSEGEERGGAFQQHAWLDVSNAASGIEPLDEQRHAAPVHWRE